MVATSPLQHHNGQRIKSEHKADPVGFLLVLIDCSVAGIHSLVQSTESLKLGLPVFYRARKPSHYLFIGRKSL